MGVQFSSWSFSLLLLHCYMSPPESTICIEPVLILNSEYTLLVVTNESGYSSHSGDQWNIRSGRIHGILLLFKKVL